MNMELSFDRAARRKERLAFVRSYAAWVKRTPNAEWSREQTVLIDSLMENARKIPLPPAVYLREGDGMETEFPKKTVTVQAPAARMLWIGRHCSELHNGHHLLFTGLSLPGTPGAWRQFFRISGAVPGYSRTVATLIRWSASGSRQIPGY